MDKEITENEKLKVTAQEISDLINSAKEEGYFEGLKDAETKRQEMSVLIKEKQRMTADRTLFKEAIEEYCGVFYFNFYGKYSIEEKQYLFRYLYLCTYMDYSNLLVIGKKYLKRNETKALLGLSTTETNRTITYLEKEKFITYTEEGYCLINSKYSKKGSINIKKKEKVEVVRMFEDAIREIYENSKPREHKKIALLISILPYVNLRYNVVCHNPEEENIDNLKPIHIAELVELLGYDKSHAARLKRDLIKIKIKGELALAVFENAYGKSILVNPKIYYKGTDLKDLDYLVSLFRLKG